MTPEHWAEFVSDIDALARCDFSDQRGIKLAVNCFLEKWCSSDVSVKRSDRSPQIPHWNIGETRRGLTAVVSLAIQEAVRRKPVEAFVLSVLLDYADDREVYPLRNPEYDSDPSCEYLEHVTAAQALRSAYLAGRWDTELEDEAAHLIDLERSFSLARVTLGLRARQYLDKSSSDRLDEQAVFLISPPKELACDMCDDRSDEDHAQQGAEDRISDEDIGWSEHEREQQQELLSELFDDADAHAKSEDDGWYYS